MPSTEWFAMPPRFARPKFSLFVVGLITGLAFLALSGAAWALDPLPTVVQGPGYSTWTLEADLPLVKLEDAMADLRSADEIRYTEEGRARVRDQLGIPEQAFVVGCISRFHPKKRNDVVVRAVCELEDENVHLILGGSGETESELRRLAEPLGERAHFIPTPGAEVADVLSAFDVSVFCPSPTEGAPRAVILGMLASRPCLSTGAEGVADMIMPEFGGITSNENDPDALRSLISRYLGDPALEIHARSGRPGPSSPSGSRGYSTRRLPASRFPADERRGGPPSAHGRAGRPRGSGRLHRRAHRRARGRGLEGHARDCRRPSLPTGRRRNDRTALPLHPRRLPARTRPTRARARQADQRPSSQRFRA